MFSKGAEQDYFGLAGGLPKSLSRLTSASMQKAGGPSKEPLVVIGGSEGPTGKYSKQNGANKPNGQNIASKGSTKAKPLLPSKSRGSGRSDRNLNRIETSQDGLDPLAPKKEATRDTTEDFIVRSLSHADSLGSNMHI